MATVIETATDLYLKHGLKKANIIAFHNLQTAPEPTESDFWLHVINAITSLDIFGTAEVDYTQHIN
ncbi:MAG: hypothetical protein HWE34_01340 [Methylocystaceae bacterium]|nr:hypothetical protein [Methylocystaceae bacterium]